MKNTINTLTVISLLTLCFFGNGCSKTGNYGRTIDYYNESTDTVHFFSGIRGFSEANKVNPGGTLIEFHTIPVGQSSLKEIFYVGKNGKILASIEYVFIMDGPEIIGIFWEDGKLYYKEVPI